uniref:CAP N-terminal domain-containing protein n=1 Tax=Hemiselmis andersenii TaxID=464988 RepID=A0A7S0TLZ9_HEMAN
MAFYQGMVQGGGYQTYVAGMAVPNMQYAMQTPPHGHQPSTPAKMGYMSPAQCSVPSAIECWRWGLPQGAVIVNAKPKLQAALVDYDKMINTELKAFTDACKKLGGAVQTQGGAVGELFAAQRSMLERALKMQKPTMEAIGKLAEGETQAAMHKVEAACEAAAEAPATLRPHTRMVAGAMSAMGWVMVEEPGGYVKDSLNAIPVYGRQVRDVEGEEHSRLVQALTDLIKALRALVEHHFAKGLIKAGGGLLDNEKYSYPAKELVQSYRLLMTNNLQPFLRSARTLTPPPGSVPLLSNPLERLAALCDALFLAQSTMIDTQVTRLRPPSEEALGRILEPTTDILNDIEELEEQENEAAGPFQLHVQLVASGLGAVAWVSVASPPLYVTEILNSVPTLGEKASVSPRKRGARHHTRRAQACGGGPVGGRRVGLLGASVVGRR